MVANGLARSDPRGRHRPAAADQQITLHQPPRHHQIDKAEQRQHASGWRIAKSDSDHGTDRQLQYREADAPAPEYPMRRVARRLDQRIGRSDDLLSDSDIGENPHQFKDGQRQRRRAQYFG